MKKYFSFVLLLFLFVNSFAQLDTEHWFAPMMDRNNNGSDEQTIYFSSNEVIPFPVTIYNNNLPIGTVNVSKGNPQKFTVPREYIITINESELFKVSTKGLYTKGDKLYFANLRFSITNHAEILTSKGKAGIGTKFYAAMAPLSISSGILNFMTSILATEDNTTVTVSGYKPTVKFSNNQIFGSTINFTLNRGESYIIEGSGSDNVNRTGFIGAKIVASNPVSVTNGNFNGQYAAAVSFSDILMDQSVPVERLGNEFALIKGNGPIGFNMEGGIIIATEDNTQVFINGGATSAANLNEGEYYRIPETQYLPTAGTVFNMSVKTSKNVYLYQLLAGTSLGNIRATGGFNYIPPLSCYLPTSVGEIGLIDENLTRTNDYPQGLLNIPTKLNIITETGALVNVNGIALLPSEGPFTLPGNPAWVTYSKENVSGNITVVSNKAVTAGIAAGDGAVGYGGYFAGFSTVAAIVKKSGNCITGVVLEVTAGFDSYQWIGTDGLDIPGQTASTFSPSLPGNYKVRVSKGSCSPVTTAPIRILNCVTISSVTKGVCGTLEIKPKLSASTQITDNNSIVIKTQGLKGIATINTSTGIITYTPNARSTGTDTFVYKFCGIGTFEDCEEVTVNLTIGELGVKDATLIQCKVSGDNKFNLSLADVTTNSPVTKLYYNTLTEAQAEAINTNIIDFTDYTSSGGDVFVVVKTPEGCSKIAKITLAFYPEIVLNASLYNSIACDDDLDDIINVDFSLITPVILQNATYFEIRYYEKLADANALNNNFLPNNWSYSAATPIYVRVISPDRCITGEAIINFRIADKVTFIDPGPIKICDNNIDGTEDILLSDYNAFFTADPDVSIKYYKTLAEANEGLPGTEINLNQSLTADINYYLRLSKLGFCDNVSILKLKFAAPKKSNLLPATDIVCEGSTKTYTLESGFTTIVWNDLTTSQTKTLGAGTYYVDLGFNDCVYRQTIVITEEKKAVLNTALYAEEKCDDNFDGKIEIKFSDITPIILQNSAAFIVKYFTNQNLANTSGAQGLPDQISYTSNTTIYVRVESANCPPIVQVLQLKIGSSLQLLKTTDAVSECDDDLDNIKSVDLSKYISKFIADSGISATYYSTEQNAKDKQSALSNPVSVNKSGSYYLRISKTGFCDVVAKLDIVINVPKASAVLFDKKICPGTSTLLDAGPGFTSYKWFDAKTNLPIIGQRSITAGTGEYFVDLESGNGCVYRQKVSVIEVDLPVITAIDIQGTIVTISVNGGNSPYQYSLNGGTYQSSNIFNNAKIGLNSISVISADECEPVSKEFSLIKITNVITPNGDNKNDAFNYADLKTKDNPKFEIYDRYGKLIFTGSENNNYTWDGTSNNRELPTSSYWYILEWQEFGTGINVKFSGWVLLKNSNF